MPSSWKKRQAPRVAGLLLLAACASSPPASEPVEVEVATLPAASGVANADLTIRKVEPPTGPSARASAGPLKTGSAIAAKATGTPIPFPFPFPPGAGAGTGAPASTATLLHSPRPKDTARIAALAPTEAPGMQLSGPPQSARFKQGEILRVSTTLAPGTCLTVIAVGDGISELDVQIAIVPGGMGGLSGIPPMVLAMDTKTGPVAIVGGGGQCFKSPLPLAMPISVGVTATQGQGEATVQLFTK